MPESRFLRRAPKQRRTEKLIETICDATLMVMREQGFQGLNTNQIAATAGIDVASLYRFFPDKLAIMQYIAERWMLDIRATWDHFSSDPELLALDWREYFTRLSGAWQSDRTQEYYDGLAGAWDFYPELKTLEREHEDCFVRFFARQMRRFGARGSRREWRDLALYLYIVEDQVHGQAARRAFSSLEAGRQLFLDTMHHHIGRLMP